MSVQEEGEGITGQLLAPGEAPHMPTETEALFNDYQESVHSDAWKQRREQGHPIGVLLNANAYIVQPCKVWGGQDVDASSRQEAWQLALRQLVVAVLEKQSPSAYHAYMTTQTSVLRDLALYQYFQGSGWTTGKNFASMSQWRSLVSSASGSALTRSSADPPFGFWAIGQRVPLSTIGDSGTLLWTQGQVQKCSGPSIRHAAKSRA